MRNHHPDTHSSDEKPAPDLADAPHQAEVPPVAPNEPARLPHIPEPINNPPYEPPVTPSTGIAGQAPVPEPKAPPKA